MNGAPWKRPVGKSNWFPSCPANPPRPSSKKFHDFEQTDNRRSQMKILVISLAGIGDALLATPLIHELRANFPEATIDGFVLWPGSRNLLENNPHLNHLHHKDLIQANE